MSNSIFEGKGLTNEEFADIIVDLKPSHYIIPDVLEDADATIENIVKFKKDFPNLPGKVICVAQGKTYEDIVRCYKVADTYGDKIAISGNLSPVDVLKEGTIEDIEEHVKRCIAQAGDNPCGYNLCPGCTTPVGTSKEHMIAFMNAAAVYGKGARKGCMPKGMI